MRARPVAPAIVTVAALPTRRSCAAWHRGHGAVVHRAAPGSPEVAFRRYDVGGVPRPIYGGITPAHDDDTSSVTAYGRGGRVRGGCAEWRL